MAGSQDMHVAGAWVWLGEGKGPGAKLALEKPLVPPKSLMRRAWREFVADFDALGECLALPPPPVWSN